MTVAAPKRVALVLLAIAVCKSTSSPALELSAARRDASELNVTRQGPREDHLNKPDGPLTGPLDSQDFGAALALEGDYFEGDIITAEYPETGRTATSDDAKLWPDGVVPYSTDTTLGSKDNLAKIREAMDSIEEKTCLRFVPREDQKDYVMLRSLRGCYSYLGRNGGEQTLSLGHGCVNKGTIVHELLHAVGFYHEHTRPDRDEYVDVFLKNVKPGQVRQFTKIDPKKIRPLTPFDYDSIMLYGSEAFARRRGLRTIVATNGSLLTEVYNKPGLSESDVTRIKMLYKCTTQ